MTTIVCISDTHGLHQQIEVPAGDILIVAGDFTDNGSAFEVRDFDSWLAQLPHPHKVVVAGNHDRCLEKMSMEEARSWLPSCHYLKDSAVELEVGDHRHIKIHGSPFTPDFYNWAFMLPRGPELQQKWKLIPESTDILVTHGPPAGYRDWVPRGERTGCVDLRDTVERLAIPLHLFGHIHAQHGFARNQKTLFCNCSCCDEHYDPIQPPQVIRWPIELDRWDR